MAKEKMKMATKKAATAIKPKPSTALAEANTDYSDMSKVPAHLQGMKTATQSNMRQQDLIIPRIKLLQALSPEIEQYRNSARPGIFWHNVLNEPIGDEDGRALEFICFRSRFFYLLFAPRNDPRGILARANDGIHWVPSEGEFKVKPKGAGKEGVVYKMAKTVEASGLADFGSQIPGDPSSQPAATLIYEYLIFLPDRVELGPMVLSLARSQIKKGKVVNTAHKQLGVAMSGLKFRDEVIQEQGAEGPYFNHQFKRHGWSTPEETAMAEKFAQQFASRDYKAAGEEDYREEAEGGPKDVPKNAKGF